MTAKRITSILIFLILVNCVGKTKENDPTEEALAYLRTLRPQHDQLTKERMNELEILNLDGTSLTDSELKYVLIFPKLRTLMLTKTRISDIGLSVLKDNKISELEIDGTLITNKSIKVLRDWKHLKILNISYTNIDDGALEDILKLNIGSLNAAGTKLSEQAKEKIRKKMQFEDEEYEIQCPGTEDSKCPEF
ncbi:hypothetical protein [Leptospira santarosai]|uniref:Leucine rich repeat protein n=1 Tax=Leptospira santarosai serovar Arenal str. MAVJ 401 TaxID=1049976 RepID=M6JJK5_9LEPT|nr:hypothetical protein [Leptospira santarosai]EMN22064.1 leucine rich repeat protein [Leptospira santarosai serovar Arenal str. MAVJ 401]MDI7230588.1 hypothetical protein [Leptospira santarosai]